MTNEWDISKWDGGMERKGLRVPECGRPARDGEWKTKGNTNVFCNLTQPWPRFRGTRHPVAPGRMKCERDVGGE